MQTKFEKIKENRSRIKSNFNYFDNIDSEEKAYILRFYSRRWMY